MNVEVIEFQKVKDGAGDGIRTRDPYLGKVNRRFSRLYRVFGNTHKITKEVLVQEYQFSKNSRSSMKQWHKNGTAFCFSKKTVGNHNQQAFSIFYIFSIVLIK